MGKFMNEDNFSLLRISELIFRNSNAQYRGKCSNRPFFRTRRWLISLGLILHIPAVVCAESKEKVSLIVEGDYVVTMMQENNNSNNSVRNHSELTDSRELTGKAQTLRKSMSENSTNKFVEKGAVAIRDDKVVFVGTQAAVHQRYQAEEIIEGTGRIVMPGLINGHTHSAMTLFRGMADDLELMTWLENYIFPMEAQFVTPEFVRTGAELACWEMIRTGTTTFVDMYFFPDVIADVVEQCGLRAVITFPVIDYPSPGFKGWDDAFAAAKEFVSRRKGKHSRVTVGFGPHAPYTVVPPHLREVAKAADQFNVPVSLHVAEAPAETAFIRQHYNTSPVKHIDKQGLLDQQLIAAHMVHLDAADIELAAKKRVGAIHNPTSNMKLASGVSPVVDMLKAGVNVALGTDGAASNNDLDMWEEIRLAAFLHKLSKKDTTVVPAWVALEMATINGARAIGMEDRIGQLKPGLQADLIQIRYDEVLHQPFYNVASHLVYVMNSRDVNTTIVAGKVLMKDRKVLTLDGAAIRQAASAKSREIESVLNKK